MGTKDTIAVIHVAKYLDGRDRLCHHDCVFCMERMEPGDSNEKLPTLNIIDDSLKRYIKDKNVLSKIYIAGGEPTLRGDFTELIQIVKQYSEYIVLSSSCDYDSEDDMINIIIETGITHVATSIHSATKSIHDRLTGCQGSFVRTISTIRKLLNAGVSVSVNVVVCSLNIDEMYSIARIFQEYSLMIEKLTFTHYMHHGNAYYHNELKFNVDDFANVISKTLDICEFMPYTITFRDFPLCLDERLMSHQEIVNNIDIIDLNSDNLNVLEEKAPSVIKDKCYQCLKYEICPKYLMANYGEE